MSNSYKSIHSLAGKIVELGLEERNRLLYKLSKEKGMTVSKLAKMARVSRSRLYQILAKFEDKKE